MDSVPANGSPGFVDVRLYSSSAIKRFAQPHYAAVGMDAHPDDIEKLLGTQRFNFGDFHDDR